MKRLTVDVTANHIKKGVCDSSRKCAIALALLDVDKNIKSVALNGREACIRFKDGTVGVYRTPARARSFIREFDDGKKVSPTSFIFELSRPEGDSVL